MSLSPRTPLLTLALACGLAAAPLEAIGQAPAGTQEVFEVLTSPIADVAIRHVAMGEFCDIDMSAEHVAIMQALAAFAMRRGLDEHQLAMPLTGFRVGVDAGLDVASQVAGGRGAFCERIVQGSARLRETVLGGVRRFREESGVD